MSDPFQHARLTADWLSYARRKADTTTCAELPEVQQWLDARLEELQATNDRDTRAAIHAAVCKLETMAHEYRARLQRTPRNW